MLRAVLELVRLHRVTIAGNYMTLVVNALCLEGLARELEPGYNVLDGAKPLLDTYGALPLPLFRVALPGLSLLKRMADRRTARRLDASDRTSIAV